MKAHKWLGLSVLLLLGPALYAQDRGPVVSMGTCVDGEPREYKVTDGDGLTDCSVGLAGDEVDCCCLNGAWAQCGDGGGGGLISADIDTSSEIRTIVTDEAGTGALMFGLTTSMADDMLCTGDQYIKRNTGDTAWECVGYAGGLTSSDIDTSSELRTILTDEVGTGSLMFGLATTTTDDLSCSGSQVVRRNSGDTAFECVSPGTLGGETGSTLNRATTAVNIDNDASETTIYSYTIPANTLDADGELRLKILSEFLNNTGTGRGYTLKFKLGGSTVVEYTTGSTAFGSTATRRVFTILVHVSQTGATNSQILSVEHYAASTSGIFGTLTTGVGLTMSNAVNVGIWNSGALSVDMTASQTLEVTVTLSAANASLEWKSYAATLELLNP